MEEFFSCVVHHMEYFKEFNHNGYVGDVETWDCDPEFWCYFEVLSKLKELGSLLISSLCYYDPELAVEMVPFRDDVAARRMQHIALLHKIVHLYVLHHVCQAEVVNMDSLIKYPILAPHNDVHENVVVPNEEEIVVKEA